MRFFFTCMIGVLLASCTIQTTTISSRSPSNDLTKSEIKDLSNYLVEVAIEPFVDACHSLDSKYAAITKKPYDPQSYARGKKFFESRQTGSAENLREKTRKEIKSMSRSDLESFCKSMLP